MDTGSDRNMEKKKAVYRRGFLLRCSVIAGCILAVICIVGFIPQHGSQMFPAVKDGDLMLTFKMTGRYHAGAVVGYRSPEGTVRLGRIVAVPGDIVDITEEGRLLINDRVVSEEIFYLTAFEGSRIGELPLKVPEDTYYILNDHRSEADDSREYGVIPKSELLGEGFWMFRRRDF